MADNNEDNDESDGSDNNQNSKDNVINIIKMGSNGTDLSKEDLIKNKLINDINLSMKLLNIDPEDNGIETLAEDMFFRNDPKYEEINDYIVGEQLGAGTFSHVKEFVHKYSLKRFAAKVMNRDWILRKGQQVHDNITLEINLVRKLNHKNVIRIFDFFAININYYMILEYCYAVLEEYLKDSKVKPRKEFSSLPKSQSHFYFCQLIEGLDYLHSIGIIHRDIKPSNILIDTSNQIKITDFGVCYILDLFNESDSMTSIEGTPFYMPPEAFDGEIESLSGTKCDIWSSGVTLYQMITGELPFNDSEDKFHDNILKNDIRFPEVITEDIPLLSLLQEIFIKDFNERITIEGIKRHPWFSLEHSQHDFRSIRPKDSGDEYRSLSIMPYVQNRFYSLSSSDEDELVTEEEYEESSDRTPNIRSNRLSLERKARNKKRISPFRRLVKLGLGADKNNS